MFGSRFDHVRLESLFDFFPIHDFPHPGEVLGPSILVVKVVSVLPNVDVEKRAMFGKHVFDHVLILSCSEGQISSLDIVAKPSPA